MDSSNVEIVKMSGSEFEAICDISKIPNKELLEIFNVSNGTLYNYFKKKRIPDEVEATVENDERFRDAYNKVIRKASTPAVIEQAAIVQSIGDIMKAVLPSIAQTISQSVSTSVKDAISQVTSVMREQMDLRERDYEMIRKTNAAMMDTNYTIMSQFTNITTHLLSQQSQPETRPKFGPSVKK